MSNDQASADDLEEVSSTAAPPGVPPTQQSRSSQKPNAFTELMKPKKKQPPPNIDRPSETTFSLGRDGLAAYTTKPQSFPQSRVVYFNDKFTVIHDAFPKSQIHLLILPRDPSKNVLLPQLAFDDPQFLEECRQEEKKVRKIVAEELRRRFGKHSRSEQTRIHAMEAEDPPSELPPGRDWMAGVKSGIHANPSMNHLHIHVLSVDHVSEMMKKSNHYRSFTTDFFVGLDQFPLSPDDYRRCYEHFPADMHCWRCGKNYGRRTAQLKDHLAEEFEDWRQE